MINTNIFNSNIINKTGVFIAETPSNNFSDIYLKVRSLEDRIYPDEIVKQLPFIDSNHPQFKEWRKRQKTVKRFINYLSKQNVYKLLEIGSGNGWFANQCSEYTEFTIGVDINLQEMEQAARVFKEKDITFLYWDIFNSKPFNIKFDLVVLNASVQYFEDINLLISRITEFLEPNGEIHILDSPFYKEDEIQNAKLRSKDYYSNLGVEEMSNFYYHHSIKHINDFEVLYQAPLNKLIRKFKKNESPFSWYRKINRIK